jgi:hypothetical protein
MENVAATAASFSKARKWRARAELLLTAVQDLHAS